MQLLVVKSGSCGTQKGADSTLCGVLETLENQHKHSPSVVVHVYP